ncbi:FMN-dependent NADH-azoreductase [Rhodanobacter sp. ANJX3]|uniref:FMN-dependent NADH-azoreductase n=1 Tax=Rhodanobacter sp. ANJX3 TaxID=2723083 RepID=UPI001622F0DA|nr:FMN-dependent NADH-azoreductase [Rhodanobacter sp. ANJX3]MBB5357805.1 FMN-dependent NADH-azoreductase [Rhodanobacter sp. ANJX3]
MKLLHIDSSALGDYSVSRQLSADIVAELKQQASDIQISYRDLAAQPLPHWTPAVADAGTAEGREGNTLVEEFLASDVVVIGAPMYNFGISSQLKSWIDRIAVAGKTFRYTEQGVEGLAKGKQVIIASSRGGMYVDGPFAAFDHQETYLTALLGFLGVTDLTFVRAEGVSISPENKEQSVKSAQNAIPSLVAKLAKAA